MRFDGVPLAVVLELEVPHRLQVDVLSVRFVLRDFLARVRVYLDVILAAAFPEGDVRFGLAVPGGGTHLPHLPNHVTEAPASNEFVTLPVGVDFVVHSVAVEYGALDFVGPVLVVLDHPAVAVDRVGHRVPLAGLAAFGDAEPFGNTVRLFPVTGSGVACQSGQHVRDCAGTGIPSVAILAAVRVIRVQLRAVTDG